MDLEVYREALLRKKLELLGASGVRPLQATMENRMARRDCTRGLGIDAWRPVH